VTRGTDALARPELCIVVATYNRSRALACAIESARRQRFTEWEMIVVGDQCTDDTAAVVGGFDDPRIRFINLSRNTGDQAGPNNVGIAEARAPLVAFLNHDDIWLPDHLALSREHLLTTGADLVFSGAACITPGSALPLQFDSTHIVLVGLAPTGRYTPSWGDASIAFASGWLARRSSLERWGGWRPAAECTVEPSQDLLFRAWRSGGRLRALNLVTFVAVSSGTRAGSYLGNEAREQEWVVAHLDDPAFPAELVARAPETSAAAWQRTTSANGWPEILASALARCRVNPREIAFRLRGYRRGEYLERLRERRGLTRRPTDVPSGTAAAVRADLARRSCTVVPGETVHFRAGGGGARFLGTGWSHPDDVGTWSDGSTAELVFDLSALVCGDARIDLELEPFLPIAGTRRCEVSAANAQDVWDLDDPGPQTRSLDLPLADGADRLAVVEVRFDGTESPFSRGLSEDRRELAVRLLSVRVRCENPE
jgi:hypothetical protein